MMNETGWIVVEIFLGIGFLMILGVLVARLTGDNSKQRGPAEMLDWRYVNGELTHEQYEQMRQDLGLMPRTGERITASQKEHRDMTALSGMHQAK
jgi:hypothetical protein